MVGLIIWPGSRGEVSFLNPDITPVTPSPVPVPPLTFHHSSPSSQLSTSGQLPVREGGHHFPFLGLSCLFFSGQTQHKTCCDLLLIKCPNLNPRESVSLTGRSKCVRPLQCYMYTPTICSSNYRPLTGQVSSGIYWSLPERFLTGTFEASFGPDFLNLSISFQVHT